MLENRIDSREANINREENQESILLRVIAPTLILRARRVRLFELLQNVKVGYDLVSSKGKLTLLLIMHDLKL